MIDQAEIHRKTVSDEVEERRDGVEQLGDAFQYVLDKAEAWKDLYRLTVDEDNDVRVSTNHSLGRASVFRATEAESEEDFRKKMKNALEFFKWSSKEATYSNPSRFCLPFYRSFYAITFGKAGAEDEVQRYLADAKNASEGSKNKGSLVIRVASIS